MNPTHLAYSHDSETHVRVHEIYKGGHRTLLGALPLEDIPEDAPIGAATRLCGLATFEPILESTAAKAIPILITPTLPRKVCAWCKRSILPFQDDEALRAYQTSGLCQDCQDIIAEETAKAEAALPILEQPFRCYPEASPRKEATYGKA